MQRLDPEPVSELRFAITGLRARYRRLMQVFEEGSGTFAGEAGISADAKVLWGNPTWAAKRDELARLQSAVERLRAEMEEQTTLAALPEATDKAVRQAMSERVAGWPDDQPAPDEAADHKAISALFAPGSLSRGEFRTVRNAVAPDEWHTQGRRRPWGQVKAKSAV